MIPTLLLRLIKIFLDFVSSHLPTWQPWPQSVLDGLGYFTKTMSGFNFLFPVDQLLNAAIFFIGFLTLFLVVKLIFRIFHT